MYIMRTVPFIDDDKRKTLKISNYYQKTFSLSCFLSHRVDSQMWQVSHCWDFMLLVSALYSSHIFNTKPGQVPG